MQFTTGYLYVVADRSGAGFSVSTRRGEQVLNDTLSSIQQPAKAVIQRTLRNLHAPSRKSIYACPICDSNFACSGKVSAKVRRGACL